MLPAIFGQTPLSNIILLPGDIERIHVMHIKSKFDTKEKEQAIHEGLQQT